MTTIPYMQYQPPLADPLKNTSGDDPNKSNPLLALHWDIFRYIFTFLNYRDVIRTFTTCRRFYVLKQDQILWKLFIRNSFTADFILKTAPEIQAIPEQTKEKSGKSRKKISFLQKLFKKSRPGKISEPAIPRDIPVESLEYDRFKMLSISAWNAALSLLNKNDSGFVPDIGITNQNELAEIAKAAIKNGNLHVVRDLKNWNFQEAQKTMEVIKFAESICPHTDPTEKFIYLYEN